MALEADLKCFCILRSFLGQTGLLRLAELLSSVVCWALCLLVVLVFSLNRNNKKMMISKLISTTRVLHPNPIILCPNPPYRSWYIQRTTKARSCVKQVLFITKRLRKLILGSGSYGTRSNVSKALHRTRTSHYEIRQGKQEMTQTKSNTNNIQRSRMVLGSIYHKLLSLIVLQNRFTPWNN